MDDNIVRRQYLKRFLLPTLGGDDCFHEGRFLQFNWSAPYIQDPAVLREYIRSIGILGTTIQGVECVGSGIYELGGIPLACIENVESETMPLYAEIDSPVILVTDKGRFEIDYSESSTVFMAKDTIPQAVYCSSLEDSDSYDSNLAFSVLKEQRIIGFQVRQQSFDAADDEFTGSYGIGLPENQDAYIKELQFILSNGQRLVFVNNYDWGYVSVYELDDTMARISSAQLRRAYL